MFTVCLKIWHILQRMTLKIKVLVITYNYLHRNKKSIMGVISNTFLITRAYSFIVGLHSAALYLATDSSLRRTSAKSSQKEVDFLLLLGLTDAERIVTNKIENISKQVYNNISTIISLLFPPNRITLENVLIR